MNHAIVFNCSESDTQASNICHTSTYFYHKMELHRIHRKAIQLPRFRWTKYITSLLKTCQITLV